MAFWVEFILCSAVIVFSGARLSRYGDIIAEKTGLGGAWIGLILMASVTSLPELISGISAVVVVGAPNIAVGDVMGSCVYNLAILAVMDYLNGTRPIFFGRGRGHLLSSGFSVLLMGVVLISIAISIVVPVSLSIPGVGHIGLYTPVIIILYIIGVRAVFFYEKRTMRNYAESTAALKKPPRYEDVTLKRALILYGVNGLIIVGAATWLPHIADALATSTGLGQSVIGSVFVAMTTSLPEVVVSVTAIRLGAQDMAVANMLGSNMFNILILAVDDIFYTVGPIFSHISQLHIITPVIMIMMTAVVVIGLTYPPEKKSFGRVGWDAFSLVGLMILSIVMLIIFSGRLS